MIIDCFMFFNEYDLLEGRLEYLYDTVDYFVIVENDRTHSGKTKPLNYAANIERYRKYQKKIIYCPVSTDITKYNWKLQPPKNSLPDVESYSPSMAMDIDQRNYISQALKMFKPTDYVLISDLDEIPSKQAIKTAVNSLNANVSAVALIQDMYYYNLKQKQSTPWAGTVITTNKSITERSPQWFRRNRWKLPNIRNAGWHLSYWNTIENIQNKIKNFAHQEYNTPEFTDLTKIVERVRQGRDLFDRENAPENVRITLEPVDRNTLPQDFLEVFAKFEPDNQKYIPHYYESVEGWFNPGDIAFYKEIVDQFTGPAHFVEIGSYKGKSSSFMAVEIANSGKYINFDCVDTWAGSPEHQAGGDLEDPDVVNDKMFDIFKQNMDPVKSYYRAKRMTSLEAAATYEDNSLDFVFIDADHSYEAVRADIIAWWPKVKPGGIISGHDYHMGAPGVINASNELLGYVRVTGSCWWHKKQV